MITIGEQDILERRIAGASVTTISEQEISVRRVAAASPIFSRVSFHTASYNVLWFLINQEPNPCVEIVLNPTREDIEIALQARDDNFSRLEWSYFKNTETATELFLSLLRSEREVRYQYKPLQLLLLDLPLEESSDSSLITQAQCQRAYNLFIEFDNSDNPFLSANFDKVYCSFTLLHRELESGLVESRSFNQGTIRPYRRAIWVRLMTSVSRQFTCLKTRNQKRDEPSLAGRIEAANKGFLIVKSELDGILKLVQFLRSKMETDQNLVRMGLAEGPDRHMMIGVMKMMRKDRDVVDNLLNELREDLCLGLKRVNEARKMLFEEIKAYN